MWSVADDEDDEDLSESQLSLQSKHLTLEDEPSP